MGSGVSKKGSPPWKECTVWPKARNSSTLLRICTMSEKPTSSSRFASFNPVFLVIIGISLQWRRKNVAQSNAGLNSLDYLCGLGAELRKENAPLLYLVCDCYTV